MWFAPSVIVRQCIGNICELSDLSLKNVNDTSWQWILLVLVAMRLIAAACMSSWRCDDVAGALACIRHRSLPGCTLRRYRRSVSWRLSFWCRCQPCLDLVSAGMRMYIRITLFWTKYSLQLITTGYASMLIVLSSADDVFVSADRVLIPLDYGCCLQEMLGEWKTMFSYQFFVH